MFKLILVIPNTNEEKKMKLETVYQVGVQMRDVPHVTACVYVEGYYEVCWIIDILDYVNRIRNGCMFAQSTPPLLVEIETSILAMPTQFQRRSPT